MSKKDKQDKITRSARGKLCQIRIPGVCNHDPKTTVLAHLPGAGMALKHLSIHGSYSCSACHDVVDFRVAYGWTNEQIKLAHHEGVIRTQIIMVDEGILVL